LERVNMDEKEAVKNYVEAEAQGKAEEPVLVASFNPPDDPIGARVYRVDFTPGEVWIGDAPKWWWVVVSDLPMNLYDGGKFTADEAYSFHLGVMLRFAHSQGYPDIPDFLLDWVRKSESSD
jgi:hypothetical protein